MIYLVISVICAALLVLIFKVFERNGVPIFQAIVYNYLFATICSVLFLKDKQLLLSGNIFHYSWVPFAVVLGGMFITVFNLTSITTVRYGVSTASVALKLGLVFPVLLAFIFYGESFNWLKIVGIVFAFVAVILSSLKDEAKDEKHKSSFAILPLAVFLGSGACDSFTQFASKKYLGNTGMEEFSLFLFASAFIAGGTIFIFQLLKKKTRFNIKSLAGGVILGIINYISFLFILKALATVSWGSSVVFPVSNLGAVACATVAGVLLFQEKISKINLLGLGFAGVAIILIIMSNYY